MDKSQKHNANKESKHQRLHTVKFNLYEILEQNSIVSEIRTTVVWSWRPGKGTGCKGAHRTFFGVMEMFCVVIVDVMVTQLYVFVKTHCVLKIGEFFTVCKLYFNKADFKN